MLINIQTVEDLGKLLWVQRSVVAQAREELMAIASEANLEKENISQAEVDKFMAREEALLEKYANYPTLSEFENDPKLIELTKWGSTFGVLLLINDLIIEQVNSQINGGSAMVSTLRSMFGRLMEEILNPKHKDLMECLRSSLSINFKQNGKPVSEKEKSIYTERILSDLVENFTIVLEAYGLVTLDEGATITPLGHRVLLHWKDSQEYIELVLDAHKRLQVKKPTLGQERQN